MRHEILKYVEIARKKGTGSLREKVEALEVQAAHVSERGLETAAANLYFIQEIRKG